MADPSLGFQPVRLPRSTENYASEGTARIVYDEDVHAFRIMVDTPNDTKQSVETYSSEGAAHYAWGNGPIAWELAK